MVVAQALLLVHKNVFKQQYTSCKKVGSGGHLHLNRKYSMKLFGPIFYLWSNCPLRDDNPVLQHLV